MSDADDEAVGWIILIVTGIGAIIFGIYKLFEWIITVAAPFVITLFGWGGILVIMGAGILIWLWISERLTWYQLAGSILFTFALWGVLSFFPGRGLLEGVGLGGRIGVGIIGYTDIASIFRVLGLVIPGMAFFIVPKILERKRRAQRREEMRRAAEVEKAAKKQAEIKAKKKELIAMIDEALEETKEDKETE